LLNKKRDEIENKEALMEQYLYEKRLESHYNKNFPRVEAEGDYVFGLFLYPIWPYKYTVSWLHQ
jgi:hypothetical protein